MRTKLNAIGIAKIATGPLCRPVFSATGVSFLRQFLLTRGIILCYLGRSQSCDKMMPHMRVLLAMQVVNFANIAVEENMNTQWNFFSREQLKVGNVRSMT